MDQLVKAMAAKFVCQHGSGSLAKITEHCEMANAIGDQSAVQAWRDIGAAVKRLLPDAASTQPASGISD